MKQYKQLFIPENDVTENSLLEYIQAFYCDRSGCIRLKCETCLFDLYNIEHFKEQLFEQVKTWLKEKEGKNNE